MINLKELTEKEMNLTRDPMLNFPWHLKEAYGLWLSQTYYMVLFSTRLVALAGALCPLEKNDLHGRFIDHSREERGHEKVCISDLKEVGYKYSDFPQMQQSACMYQIQYYWIQQVSPISFFGYTLALESLAESFGAEVYKLVKSNHGANAAKFLKLHSEADIDHMESAYEQLEKLNENEKKIVYENLLLSSSLYRSMLIEGKSYVEKNHLLISA